MITVTAIIERFGGRGPLADALGLDYQTVRGWDAKQSIPAHWWRAIVNLADERGVSVSLDDLADVAEAKRLEAATS